MKEIKTHTLLQTDSQGRPNLVFSFQDWGDHYRVRVDGRMPLGYAIFTKGEYSFSKFVFRYTGEVRKMHIDVAREIYTALLNQGLTKPDYSPHIEMVHDDELVENYGGAYSHAINA